MNDTTILTNDYKVVVSTKHSEKNIKICRSANSTYGIPLEEILDENSTQVLFSSCDIYPNSDSVIFASIYTPLFYTYVGGSHIYSFMALSPIRYFSSSIKGAIAPFGASRSEALSCGQLPPQFMLVDQYQVPEKFPYAWGRDLDDNIYLFSEEVIILSTAKFGGFDPYHFYYSNNSISKMTDFRINNLPYDLHYTPYPLKLYNDWKYDIGKIRLTAKLDGQTTLLSKIEFCDLIAQNGKSMHYIPLENITACYF